MEARRRLLFAVASTFFVAPAMNAAGQERPGPFFAALVFSKTSAFRHESILDGIAAIKALGAEHGFKADATENAAAFTEASDFPPTQVTNKSPKGSQESKITAGRMLRPVHLGDVG